jgi:hypothetical protein
MCAIHPRLSPEQRAALEQRVSEIQAEFNAALDSRTPRSRLATEWESLLSELSDLKEQLAI